MTKVQMIRMLAELEVKGVKVWLSDTGVAEVEKMMKDKTLAKVLDEEMVG
jgi:hypothetical protein